MATVKRPRKINYKDHDLRELLNLVNRLVSSWNECHVDNFKSVDLRVNLARIVGYLDGQAKVMRANL